RLLERIGNGLALQALQLLAPALLLDLPLLDGAGVDRGRQRHLRPGLRGQHRGRSERRKALHSSRETGVPVNVTSSLAHTCSPRSSVASGPGFAASLRAL